MRTPDTAISSRAGGIPVVHGGEDVKLFTLMAFSSFSCGRPASGRRADRGVAPRRRQLAALDLGQEEAARRYGRLSPAEDRAWAGSAEGFVGRQGVGKAYSPLRMSLLAGLAPMWAAAAWNSKQQRAHAGLWRGQASPGQREPGRRSAEEQADAVRAATWLTALGARPPRCRGSA